MPGLDWQRHDFPFASGLDETTDARQTSKLTSIQNLQWEKTGQLRKRNGYTKLSPNLMTGGVLSGGFKLATYKGELLYFDDVNDQLLTWSPGKSKWVIRDQVPRPTCTRLSLAQAETTEFSPDIAFGSGCIVYVWLGDITAGLGGTVYASVIDATTGATIQANVALNAPYRTAPRVLIANGFAVAIFSDGIAGIECRTLDLSTPGASWAGPFTLAADGVAPLFPYGACALSDRFVIAYESTAAAPNAIRVKSWSFASTPGALSSVQLTEAIAVVGGFGLQGTTGERVHVGYTVVNVGASVRVTTLNTSTLATLVAPTELYNSGADPNSLTQAISIARISSTQSHIVWQPGDFRTISIGFNATTLAAVGVACKTWGVQLQSEIWFARGKVYGLTYANNNTGLSLQGSLFLLDFRNGVTVAQPARPVATIAPRLCLINAATGSSTRCASTLCGVVSPLTDQYTTIASAVMDANVKGRVALTQVTANLADTARYQCAEVADSMYASGGVPSTFDGVQYAEAGFLLYPEAVTTTPAGAGGSMLPDTYLYAIVYEYVDARGQRHRSAPSVAVSAVTVGVGAVNQVTLHGSNLGLTTRQELAGNTRVGIIAYRTKGSGTVFYRITPDDVPAANWNDPTTATFTIVDRLADSAIGSNPILYTTGGVLPNFCPPSASLCIQHRGRVWLAGCDNPKAVWYSKQITTGEAPGFNDALQFIVDDGGAITALASMDDKLVIFKADRIFVVFGDGPNDTGIGSDLSAPQRVPADAGCIEARSVISTPEGLLFQSAGGITLLSRGLEVQYIGSPVTDTLAANPIISSAVIVEPQNHVRFTCEQGNGLGKTIVYDYLHHEWSVFSLTDPGTLTTAAAAATSAILWGGVYTWASQAQWNVYTERAPAAGVATFTDGGQWISSSFETAWLKLAGVSGFQRLRRVRLIGENVDPSNLTMAIANDYLASYPQTHTWTAADITTTLGGVLELEVRVDNQKTESIRLRVFDAAPSGGPTAVTSAGAYFTGFAIEVGIKRGGRPLAAAAKA